MAENKDNEKEGGDEEKAAEDPIIPQKPKHIFRKNLKNDLSRSKSAPADQFTNDNEENEDYIGSYNYFIYYNSIKPKNPHLPKPTYKPKPNLDFIKETKDKEEEDEETPERNENININPIESITKELNQLNLDPNTNTSNNQDTFNQNLFNEDFMNNFQKNQNSNKKNNFNQSEEALSPFEYYSPSMNVPNQPNDIAQQQIWKDQNLAMSGMGLGMYNPAMAPAMGGMVGMGMNPINPLMGMNMGMNPYGNLPQYGNMMGMNPSYVNYRMLQGNNQYNRGKKTPVQKKGNNRAQEGMEPIPMQNQMLNMYNNQVYNGYQFAQQNPMMNMNMNMNYLNDQRFPMMQMDQQFLRNNMMQGDMNNYEYYQNNLNNANKMHAKKNKKGENFVRKEANEYKNIEDIIEKAVDLSKDHSGSRLVQRKYEEGSDEIRNKIFEKFKPEILNLSKDIFGNYAIQKVLEFKDKEKNNFIMEALKGKIYELSLHMYGCRVMQQLITVIDENYLVDITKELEGHYAKCIEDQNGNHVIQKLIERLKPGKENNGIYEVVYKNIVELSKHQYGCRVIQTLLKKCNEKQVTKMLEKIYKDVKELSEDQYGNYIIQYILENQKGKNVDSIYEGLKGNIYDFSIHKYASNVVERALTFGNEKQRQNIINEIIEQDDQVKECLLSMVKDKFGNYVVQKIIEFSTPEMRKNIINRIIMSQSFKKKDGFSKHVINFIEKLNSQNGGIIDLNSTTGEKNEGKNMGKKGDF